MMWVKCQQSRRLACLMIVLFSLAGSVRAQYDVSFAHYYDMQPAFNPAAAGQESKLNITAAYAMDFTGFENNPKTLYVAADMPISFLKMNHGVGIQLMNDDIGLFTHQRLALQYAAKFKLFGGQLSAGVQGGILNEKFKGSKIDLEESTDPAFNTGDINGTAFDLAVGVHYKRGPLFVGLSMTHVTAPTVELGETNELKVSSSYYLTAGYNIKLRNPFITIHPSIMVRTDFVDHREDITCRAAYKFKENTFSIGAGYAWDKSATIYLGAVIKKFNIGYSYEIYTRQIKFGNGSHELMVSYQLDVNTQKKGRNLHKSVRYL